MLVSSRIIYKIFIFLIVGAMMSFTLSGDTKNYGITVKKTIKKIDHNHYEVGIHIKTQTKLMVWQDIRQNFQLRQILFKKLVE